MTVKQQKLIYAKLSLYAHRAYNIQRGMVICNYMISDDMIKVIAKSYTKKELVADLKLFNEFLFTPMKEG